MLADMLMPKVITGAALANQLLRRQPDLRVVCPFSYSPDILANEHVLQAGVNFVGKLFAHGSVLCTVKNALRASGVRS